MSLQPTLGRPAQPSAEQTRALLAIAHMQQAAQASDDRVQQATDQTFIHMQEALKQSEANNLILADRIAQLIQENSILKQQIRALNSGAEVQRRAQEAAVSAEKERVRALMKSASAELGEITKYAATSKQNYEASIPELYKGLLDPLDIPDYLESFQKSIAQMNKFIEHGRKIELLIKQINQ